MGGDYIAALAAFLGGSVISVINAVITAKQVQSEKQSLSTGSIVRQTLSLIYLAGVFYIVRKLGISYLMPMRSASCTVFVRLRLLTHVKWMLWKGFRPIPI